MKLREALAADILRTDLAGDYWFGDAEAEFALAQSTQCVSPRLGLAVVRVTGADAESFLQGQLITNLEKVDPQHGSLSAWCTPQGRVSFLFHLLPTPEGYLLLTPESEAARLLQRLKMFVLRAKVILEDISTQYSVLGLSLPRTSPKLPLAALQSTRHMISRIDDDLRALCIDDSARFLVCGETATVLEWWRTSPLPRIGSAAWRLLDIAQGYAEITGDHANNFLPQQLNLDMVDALAFDKGCYPGQEIIARLKYRGEVKTRLLRGHATTEIPAGARLITRTGAHSAGPILTTVTLPSHQTRFLAVVEPGALQNAPQLDGALETELQFELPPYWCA